MRESKSRTMSSCVRGMGSMQAVMVVLYGDITRTSRCHRSCVANKRCLPSLLYKKGSVEHVLNGFLSCVLL